MGNNSPIKRKSINPRLLLDAKKNKQLVTKSDTIKIDFNDSQQLNKMSRLKEEYSYELIDCVDLIDSLELENNTEQLNDIIRIDNAHCYNICETPRRMEKNSIKRKLINPRLSLDAKKNKHFVTKSDDFEDTIKIDFNVSQEQNEMPRLKQEHRYQLIDCVNLIDSLEFKKEKEPQQILYFLYRYNDLYKHKFKSLNQIDIGFFNIVDYRDWVTLEKNKQLANFILDISILCILKEYNFHNAISLPCQIDDVNYAKVKMLMAYKPKYIIIPIVSGFHFTLCILKLVSRQFVYFDSKFNNSGKDHYDKFVNDNKQNEVFKFISIHERQKQKDNVNCGIYVILYLIRFLKGESYFNLGNIHEFKESLKPLLRRNSDNISKFCCHCGNMKKKRTKCMRCNYHVCRSCIRDKHKYDNNFNLCKICTNNIKV